MTMHPKTHDRLHDLFVYLFFFFLVKKKGELFCHILVVSLHILYSAYNFNKIIIIIIARKIKFICCVMQMDLNVPYRTILK